MRMYAIKIFYPTDTEILLSPERAGWTEGDAADTRRFQIKAFQPVCLRLYGSENRGSGQALLRTESPAGSYTFKPADVSRRFPIYVRQSGFLVTEECDDRTYGQIVDAPQSLPCRSETERAAHAEQMDFVAAAKDTERVNRSCPTWLGVPGDMRVFELGFRGYPIEERQHMELYDYIQPRCNWDKFDYPEYGIERMLYRYLVGRGMGCTSRIVRRLEEGYLPILHASVFDGELEYRMTSFVGFADGKPVCDAEGTDYLVADGHSAGHTFTERQQAEYEARSQIKPRDFPVLRMRISVINRANCAKLAFVRLPHVNTFVMAEREDVKEQRYDGETGMGSVGNLVYLRALLDGRPCEALETSPVVFPGSPVTYELVLFHGLVDRELAQRVKPEDFADELKRVRSAWKSLCARQSVIRVPERRICEMWRAGYWHVLQNTFTQRASDVAAATVGVYSPIGSESAAAIDFLNSSRNAELARRSVNYFFAKQRPDGFIQNQTRYMLETGGTLCIASSCFRYTGDRCWLKKIESPLLKACDYLLAWIQRNSADPGTPGFGMIEGQVADPVDNYRLFSLNAGAYAGLAGAAELMKELENPRAEELESAAECLRENILIALRSRLKTAVLTPVGDGGWLPLLPPWAETDSAVCLHTQGGVCTTHASCILKDSLLSVATLIRFGVLRPEDALSDLIVQTHEDLFTEHNTAFSQPYYNVIPWALLRRGQVNAYLDEFYHAMSALADRETYSFWEHYFLATPHKIAEEAQFLMRLRELLYYEDLERRQLHLMRAVPEKWKNARDNTIAVEGAGCQFGKLSFSFARSGGNYLLKLECGWNEYREVEVLVYPPVARGERVISCAGWSVEDGVLRRWVGTGSHEFPVEVVRL